MGRGKRRDRSRNRGSRSGGLTRRQILSAGVAALGGAGLLVGTRGFSLVEASRSGEVDVATGENAAIGVDIPPYVLSDHANERLVTVTNRTGHELTFGVDLESPGQGTVSPTSATVAPDGEATFYASVPDSGPNASLPFTIDATNGQGFTVTLPRSTAVYGLSRFIRDRSKNSNAGYDFTYRIDGFPEFAELTVEFNNLDESWATESFTSTDRKDTVVYSRGGAMNCTYEITWTAYDGDGGVLFRNTVTDESDGTNPPNNDDLQTPDDPSLESFTVTDATQYNNTDYTVDYEVANLDRFQRVEVTFENTEPNKDWATDTVENTSAPTGTVSYSQGGTENDEYEITVAVINTDGFIVDSGTVTDVAGGNNTVTYP